MADALGDDLVDRGESRYVVDSPVDELADARGDGVGAPVGRVARSDARHCVVLFHAEAVATAQHRCSKSEKCTVCGFEKGRNRIKFIQRKVRDRLSRGMRKGARARSRSRQ